LDILHAITELLIAFLLVITLTSFEVSIIMML